MNGSIRRLLPPLMLFGGLTLFGLSLLVLGTSSLESNTEEFHASTLTVADGQGVLLYPVRYYGYDLARIDVTYEFPQAPGDAFFVSCADAERLRTGGEPLSPALAFTNQSSGSFVVNEETAGQDDSLWLRGGDLCAPSLAFRWDAAGGDPNFNRPDVTAIYSAPRLDRENAPFLLAMMVLGVVLAFVGGLRWSRVRRGGRAPSVESPDSTVEALRRTLDRMGDQLERTRRHHVFAGVLGIFLWYPFLVPWAWRQAARESTDASIPWLVAGATATFLVALTFLWWRELTRLDLELDAWRGRIEELRRKEEDLMDTLEGHGG